MADLPIIGANPVDTPQLYDSFRLAGQDSPGVCSFDSPPKRGTGWDLQAPSGGSGGYTVKHKVPPISFTVKLYLWKGDDLYAMPVDHFSKWETFKRLLVKPVKTTDPKALAIYHPQLAGLQPPVTDVVVGSASEPAPDGKGGAWVEILFHEFRPFRFKAIKGLNGTTTAKNRDPNQDLKDFTGYMVTVQQQPTSSTFDWIGNVTDWVGAGRPREWTGHNKGESP